MSKSFVDRNYIALESWFWNKAPVLIAAVYTNITSQNKQLEMDIAFSQIDQNIPTLLNIMGGIIFT